MLAILLSFNEWNGVVIRACLPAFRSMPHGSCGVSEGADRTKFFSTTTMVTFFNWKIYASMPNPLCIAHGGRGAKCSHRKVKNSLFRMENSNVVECRKLPKQFKCPTWCIPILFQNNSNDFEGYKSFLDGLNPSNILFFLSLKTEGV